MVIEEEDSAEDEEDDENGANAVDDHANREREERALQKEEIKELRTQLLTMREKLADKTAKIDKIKDNLAMSAVTYNFD